MQEITDTTRDRVPAGLPIAGRQVIKAPFDGGEAAVDRGQPGRDGINQRSRRLAAIGRSTTAEHGVEVLGMPTQRDGQRFQRPGITTTLSGVAMQLAHDGHRYLSPLSQLPLPPIELGRSSSRVTRTSSQIISRLGWVGKPRRSA